MHHGAAVEERQQRGSIAVERDVEDGDDVAVRGAHRLQQRDVALEPGDDGGVEGIGEAQLLQRADTVRVAVEHVVVAHRSPLYGRRLVLHTSAVLMVAPPGDVVSRYASGPRAP